MYNNLLAFMAAAYNKKLLHFGKGIRSQGCIPRPNHGFKRNRRVELKRRHNG